MSQQVINSAEVFLDLDAEMAVLGCILHDSRVLPDVRPLLTSADFYILRHGYVYTAIIRLAEQQKAIDLITVASELRALGHFDNVGGHAYLAQLAGALVSTRSVETYAYRVADLAYQRRLLDAADKVRALALDPDFPTDIRQTTALALIMQAGVDTSDSDVSFIGDEMGDYIEAVENSVGLPPGISGLATGLLDLDDLLDGFQPGSLNLLGGRPGMGKSAIMMCVALNVAKALKRANDPRVVYLWSGEMPKKQLRERAMSIEAGIDSKKLRRGLRQNGMDSHEYQRFIEAAGRIGQLPIYFDDCAGMSPLKLQKRVERLAARQGVALIILDYLQLMQPAMTSGRIENRHQELSGISRFLKRDTARIAPVLAGVQLNRDLEKRADKHPTLPDLRESGSLEEDADTVTFAYRDIMYNPGTDDPNILELIVAKNRHWSTGMVKAVFQAEYTRVLNLAREAQR